MVMNCSSFKDLMFKELDSTLSHSEMESLQSHLDSCRTCALYRERLQAMISSLEADSEAVSHTSATRNLDPLVCQALYERSERNFATRGTLRQLWDTLCLLAGRKTFAPVGVALAAVLLFAASYTLINSAVVAEPDRADSCRIGHIASFSAEVDSEGRVYAAVIEHNSSFLTNKGRIK